MNSKNFGFTLIEVLIASFIIFIVLASFTLVYRGALLSSHKAQISVDNVAYTSLIVNKITDQLSLSAQQSMAQGQGEIFNATYQWQAKVIKIAKPPARYFGGELTQSDNQIKLWQISLAVTTQSATRHFEYEDTTW